MMADKRNDLIQQILDLFTREYCYRDCDLTLDTLAERVGSNRTYLSQAINAYWGNHFLDFLNHFRINEAKQILLASTERKTSMLKVAYDVGFGAKSTFNRVFKAKTGQTPREFHRRSPRANEMCPCGFDQRASVLVKIHDSCD